MTWAHRATQVVTPVLVLDLVVLEVIPDCGLLQAVCRHTATDNMEKCSVQSL